MTRRAGLFQSEEVKVVSRGQLCASSLFFGLFAPLMCVTHAASAQTAEELSVMPRNVYEPPSTLPAECPASLLAIAEQTSGSTSYVRLKRLLTAMELGHEGSVEMLSALSSTSSSSSVGEEFLHINIQLSSASNKYLCASFLTGRIKTGGVDSYDETAVRTFITVFNRMFESSSLMWTWHILLPSVEMI